MRRRRSQSERPSNAADRGGNGPAQQETLERIERSVTELRAAVDVNNKRIMALQAQVDHIEARIGRRLNS